MAHIYMTFDFGADEEKAQQARHKLDVWKQAFRLDKRLLYKFERPAQEGDGTLQAEAAHAKVEKPATKAGGTKAKAKAKAKAEDEEKPVAASLPTGPVKLHLRLAFSGHEKMTEERWLKRIPSEQPFRDAAPETTRSSDAAFTEVEGKFETLDG